MTTTDGHQIDSTSDKSPVTFYFADLSPVPSESGLHFNLIHLWVARNTASGGSCSSSTNMYD
ncbi:hypothetical protein Bca4012_100100 [Brassica carinata]|uniref:Uncharacterized protein n=1 Tax=Brassica carinata TaxID=52824 RepID=A0A8X7PIL1_BRACI|nr:hypothetical protein Bca52824_082672 [Brassica carinata]